MMTSLIYYKKNVPFNVGIRFHIRDNDGMVLSNQYPFVAIEPEKLRDFMMANKGSIERGLIIKTEEPDLNINNANTIDDEQAAQIVKNVFVLKKKLTEISSETALLKLYEAAKSQRRSTKVLEMIEERLAEISPLLMQGITTGSE
jgi:hypothetical protein